MITRAWRRPYHAVRREDQRGRLKVEVVERARIHGLLEELMEPREIFNRIQLRQHARGDVDPAALQQKHDRLASRCGFTPGFSPGLSPGFTEAGF